MINDKQMDVSVIVPVYNHEKYLAKALDSILVQKTKYSFEILIGEDCSTDGSRAIVKEYEREHPDVIRAFCRTKNIGPTKNGYALYMASRGRYIALLEGDDYWCDEYKLERQISFLDTHSEYIGVAHNFCKVDQNGCTTKEKCISDKETSCEFTWKDFLDKSFLFQSATLVYRNFWTENNDFSILYKAHDIVGDMTIFTILLNRSNIYIMPDVMSAYREVISNSATNACSIAFRDLALSSLKTVRQLHMLRPFLQNEADFNRKIIEIKAGFIIELVRHKTGYTLGRWRQLSAYGDMDTNTKAFLLIGRMIKNKLLKRDNLYE